MYVYCIYQEAAVRTDLYIRVHGGCPRRGFSRVFLAERDSDEVKEHKGELGEVLDSSHLYSLSNSTLHGRWHGFSCQHFLFRSRTDGLRTTLTTTTAFFLQHSSSVQQQPPVLMPPVLSLHGTVQHIAVEHERTGDVHGSYGCFDGWAVSRRVATINQTDEFVGVIITLRSDDAGRIIPRTLPMVRGIPRTTSWHLELQGYTPLPLTEKERCINRNRDRADIICTVNSSTKESRIYYRESIWMISILLACAYCSNNSRTK